VTAHSAPSIREAVIACAVALLLLAVSTTNLNAPGPAREIIEPRTRMQLVRLGSGTFQMGSRPDERDRRDDETLHEVTLSKVVYIGRYEVTQAEWATVMGGNPSAYGPCDGCPVENVDFYKVSEFISNLNAQTTSMRFRLPTEAEWEHACATAPPWWPDPAGGGPGTGRPTRVWEGKGPGVGAFDLRGNVAEWVNDWFGPYPPGPVTDPPGPAAGLRRVVRGGSFLGGAGTSRCAYRSSMSPQDRSPAVGFRVVAEPIVEEGGDRDYLNR
jgi:formylglycine-generating enzyme required for sulfatase activity